MLRRELQRKGCSPALQTSGGCFPEPENFFCCGFAFGDDKCPENWYLFKNSRISQGRFIKTVVITAPSSRGRRKGAGQQGGGASGFWARSEASLIFYAFSPFTGARAINNAPVKRIRPRLVSVSSAAQVCERPRLRQACRRELSAAHSKLDQVLPTLRVRLISSRR